MVVTPPGREPVCGLRRDDVRKVALAHWHRAVLKPRHDHVLGGQPLGQLGRRRPLLVAALLLVLALLVERVLLLLRELVLVLVLAPPRRTSRSAPAPTGLAPSRHSLAVVCVIVSRHAIGGSRVLETPRDVVASAGGETLLAGFWRRRLVTVVAAAVVGAAAAVVPQCQLRRCCCGRVDLAAVAAGGVQEIKAVRPVARQEAVVHGAGAGSHHGQGMHVHVVGACHEVDETLKVLRSSAPGFLHKDFLCLHGSATHSENLASVN